MQMDEGYAAVSQAVRTSLEPTFSQLSLMTSDDFEDLCEDRDISMNIDDMEFLESLELLTPMARLVRPFKEEGSSKRYFGYSLSTWALREHLREGSIRFLESGQFRPWEDYKDGFYDREIHLYHRYQLFQVLSVFNATRMIMTPQSIGEEMNTKKLVEWKNAVIAALSKNRTNLMKKLSLLIQLETPYLPQYQGSFKMNMLDPDSLNKWKEWRYGAFAPEKVLAKSGFTVNEVANLRDTIGVSGDSTDPLSAWYMLVRIASRDKKRRLRGKAQLAQDLYEMTGLLNLFLKDLTGEEQPEPDDITDMSRGSWKPERYGSPFSYDDKKIRARIVEDYLDVHPPKAVLFVEGDTEEQVITSIVHSLGVDLGEFGINLHNCQGYGGLRQIEPALRTWKEQDVHRFILLDNDENNKEYVDELLKQGLIEAHTYKIWDSDFERDNFGTEQVVSAVNAQLTTKGLPSIELGGVQHEIENERVVLMRAIRQVYGRIHHINLFDCISKVELARQLVGPRLREIEVSEGKYEPRLPIEKYLVELYTNLR
jgi:hypothetical protein